jgi:hypothetical protein
MEHQRCAAASEPLVQGRKAIHASLAKPEITLGAARHDPKRDHCCPKQDRVVRMPAEGKGLESRKSGFSG